VLGQMSGLDHPAVKRRLRSGWVKASTTARDELRALTASSTAAAPCRPAGGQKGRHRQPARRPGGALHAHAAVDQPDRVDDRVVRRSSRNVCPQGGMCLGWMLPGSSRPNGIFDASLATRRLIKAVLAVEREGPSRASHALIRGGRDAHR
jgi:hypothetical protein